MLGMRLHDQVLSEEDFEQLPPALRRKVSLSSILIRHLILPHLRYHVNKSTPLYTHNSTQHRTDVRRFCLIELQFSAYNADHMS